MKKLFILFAFLLIPAFAHGADVTGPFEHKLQCVSHVSSTVTGTTDETTLATCTIPGGAIGANGTLWVSALWTYTNGGNNKTLRVNLNGSSCRLLNNNVTSTANTNWLGYIRNANSQSRQLGTSPNTSPYNPNSGAVLECAVDTSATTTLTATCTLASAGDSRSLVGLDAWIMRQ